MPESVRGDFSLSVSANGRFVDSGYYAVIAGMAQIAIVGFREVHEPGLFYVREHITQYDPNRTTSAMFLWDGLLTVRMFLFTVAAERLYDKMSYRGSVEQTFRLHGFD